VSGEGAHLWRSELLGERRMIEVGGGRLDYFERGEGPALLFSHGWLANANLWRKVVDRLAADFRCLTLDLPLGSHRTPMDADADLSPLGVAGLIAEAVESLELDAVTLVGNDSGGAYSQIALARHRQRIDSRVTGLVLTSCETPYDEWPARGGGRRGRPRTAARRARRSGDPLHTARLRPPAQAPDRGRGLRLLRAPRLAGGGSAA
jgi:pimeloyl-ACP methyl ester carboxylesterase